MTTSPVLDGRVIITWPAPINGVVNNTLTTLTDADSGEDIVSAFKLSLVLGTDTGFEPGVIVAEIVALVDEHGKLSRSPVATEEYATHRALTPDTPFEGQEIRTGIFRYAVAEMRTA